MMKLRSPALTLLTGCALTACGGDSNSPTDTGGGGNGGDGGSGNAPVEILMQNTAFVAPGGGDAVTVTVGTTVEWVNMDGVQHTATSSATPPGGASFNSGIMRNGDRFEFTPRVAGTWTYLCEVHPGIMRDATITATSSGSGNSDDDDRPSNPDMPGDPDYPDYPSN